MEKAMLKQVYGGLMDQDHVMKRADVHEAVFHIDTQAANVYASRAVQFHPHGGQFDFVWISARTPHGAYVW